MMVWLPVPRLLFENEACPEPFSGAVARGAEPSRKVTEPAGVPKLEVTVEVKVTDWPEVVGLRELESDVDVERALTVWVRERSDVVQVVSAGT